MMETREEDEEPCLSLQMPSSVYEPPRRQDSRVAMNMYDVAFGNPSDLLHVHQRYSQQKRHLAKS